MRQTFRTLCKRLALTTALVPLIAGTAAADNPVHGSGYWRERDATHGSLEMYGRASAGLTEYYGTNVIFTGDNSPFGISVGQYSIAEILGNSTIAAGTGVIVEDGGSILLDGTTVTGTTTGMIVNEGGKTEIRNSVFNGAGTAIRVMGTAEISNSTISTTGSTASGIIANGAGSSVKFSDSTVTTSGQQAHGFVSRNDGAITTEGSMTVVTRGSNAHGANAESGGIISLAGGKIETYGYGSHGLRAYKGTIISNGPLTISTESGGAYGAYIDNGRLELSNADISTKGANAHGVYATANGRFVIESGSISTEGSQARGVFSAAGSDVTIRNTDISTSGSFSAGVEVNGASNVGINSGSVKTTGNDSAGLYAIGQNASMQAQSTRVTTEGARAHGAYALATGPDKVMTLSGVDIETKGAGSHGVQVDQSHGAIENSTVKSDLGYGLVAIGVDSTGKSSSLKAKNIDLIGGGATAQANGTVEISGASIKTSGDGRRGLVALSGGTVKATDVGVVTAGNAAHGAHVGGVRNGVTSSLSIAGGSIKTDGAGAHGVFAENGGLTTIALGKNNPRITTTGEGSFALRADTGGLIDATGADVRTLGDGSHAVVVTGGSTVNLTYGGYNTNGVGAHSVMASGGSTVTMNGSIFQVFGADSYGVSLADDSTVVAEKSFISSYAPALKTEGGNVVFDLRNGTQVVGTNGTVLSAASGSTTTLKADDKVQLSGDMVAEADDAVINASLSNGSQWYGAARGGTNASIDATSYWLMTGSSDVGSLTNDGVIEFDAANPYKTLTAGSLAMNGGSFILNTKLNEGGAASETDRIVVTGDASGNGLINIRNNGGTGAFTGTGATDGIQVVQVGGASDAEFKLGSAAIVGIYDYQLKKADGQNWYLQTEGKDVVDPPVDPVDPVDPTDPTDPVDPIVDPGTGNPGTGHVVDIVPGYNIALSAAQNHVLTSLDTFHERLGELRAEDLNDGYHAWMRGIGKTGSYSPKSVTGYNGHGFDMTTAGVQIGADYSKSDVFVAGDKLTIGIFGEYANSSFDVRGRTADGSISSKGLGGYVTWQQKAPTDRKPGTGAYVDAVVKQDWLDFGVSAKSVSGFDLQNSYKGKATTASIEAGYGFDLGNNVVLQPQAQLTWSKVKADSFTDPYGIAVHGQEAESLIGRVGVRLEKTFYFGDEEESLEAAPTQKAQKPVKGQKANKGKNAKTAPVALPEAPSKKKFVKSVTTYADANVKREFKGKNGLVASNTGIGNDMGGTRADIGVGVVARVSENVSLFGRGSVEFGGSTNVAGKVSGGLKITW
ncbi:autotransporter outer membrane beta-barrel domain-containing protein [Brucella anthropi]|uniref:autotransporter outer membrane beta-barrel domain-containing protein n=1 Tax=Brucella anthropi TaxID=529 RepID=UPI0015E37E81|nr:autotransporter outer membrane beta-barrel domain-containing protein [Ochrobactrum sp. MYb49]